MVKLQGEFHYFNTIFEVWQIGSLILQTKFNKTYSGEEDAERLELYKKSKVNVAEHNQKYARGESTYEQDLNQFADLKPKEKLRYLG